MSLILFAFFSYTIIALCNPLWGVRNDEFVEELSMWLLTQSYGYELKFLAELFWVVNSSSVY